MTGCLEWAAGAVAALALGLPAAGAPCLEDPGAALVAGAAAGLAGATPLAEAALARAEAEPGLAALANHVGGVWSLAVGDAVAARTNFAEAVRRDPDLARARVGLILAQARSGRAAAARAAASALVARPGDLRTAADLRVMAVDEVLLPVVQARLHDLGSPCPPCARSLGEAVSAAALRRPRGAATGLWSQAAALLAAATPGRDVWVLRGRALTAAGRNAEARAVYAEAVSADAGWPYARLLLGTALFDADRAQEAVPHLRAAAQGSGAAGEAANLAWSALGVAERRLGRLDEAVAAYAKAGAARVGDVVDRGQVLLALARPSEAVQAFEAAVVKAPDLPAAWYGLMRARLRLGDARGAGQAEERYRVLSDAAEAAYEQAERDGRAVMAARDALESPGRAAAVLDGVRDLPNGGMLTLARAVAGWGRATPADVVAVIVDANAR